jgi:wyosine [tRNA(Phe)-imidazoG37] synthetase (radical SAM superfamily)
MTRDNDNAEPHGPIIFGPVPSRRLGVSLGVDIIPRKVCSYDCVYCEVGPTTLRTLQRREYIPAEEIETALDEYFRLPHPELDYVTLAGSGEPTLNTCLGRVIRKIRTLTTTPVAVLTNGSLLFEAQVRADLGEADLVVPSLDAATDSVFYKINRPSGHLPVKPVIEGIATFCREFPGKTQLEILLVRGVNDTLAEIDALVAAVEYIRPAGVQLSTVVRPPGRGKAAPVDEATLRAMAGRLTVPVSVVGSYQPRTQSHEVTANVERLRRMLEIRPVALEDLSSCLGLHRTEVREYLEQLAADGELQEEEFAGQVFYSLTVKKKPGSR